MIPFILNIQNRQFSRDQKQISACLGLRGRRKWEGTDNGHWVSLWSDGSISKLDCGDRILYFFNF